MKLAIMQPYFCPYIGYFQLVNAVDKFVILDDVNFIKQGWINRNYILNNAQKGLFTIPLEGVSSYKLIKDIKIEQNQYKFWQKKFLKTISQNYSKAPYFENTYNMIEKIVSSKKVFIVDLIYVSLEILLQFLNIKTTLTLSSEVYKNNYLKSQERIIDICLQEGATNYINSIGGLDLYSKTKFIEKDISLSFIDSYTIEYKQFNIDFIHNLSIIDVMMFNSKNDISLFLSKYKLI